MMPLIKIDVSLAIKNIKPTSKIFDMTLCRKWNFQELLNTVLYTHIQHVQSPDSELKARVS